MDKRSGIVEREQGPLDQRAEGERSGVTLYVVTSADFNRSLSHHCMQIGLYVSVASSWLALGQSPWASGFEEFIHSFFIILLLIIFFSSLAIVIIIN